MRAQRWPLYDAVAPAELRRYVVQALGRNDWPLGLLTQIASRLKGLDWPDGALGAEIGVLRALGGVGDLRLQLLGAFAIPGWDVDVLIDVAKLLCNASAGPCGEEIVGLRAMLAGRPL